MSEQFDASAINHSTDLVALVGRYCELTKRGTEYVTRCVDHSPDNNPSMYVSPQKGFVHCFSCGFHADAIAFLMRVENIAFPDACKRLTNGGMNALPPVIPQPERSLAKAPPRKTYAPPMDAPRPDMGLRTLGEPTGVWIYRTAESNVLGYVCRYDTPEGKQIRCWSWGNHSDAEPARWECRHFAAPRPLYGLDRLAARPTAQVLIVEGERTADAAQRLFPGMVAITWAGGAQAHKLADWSVLAGRKVVLCPDNDAAGRQAMSRLAVMLWEAGVIEIKGIDTGTYDDNGMLKTLTEAPESWDLADAPADNWTPDQALTWAKARLTVYEKPQRDDISTPPQEAISGPESDVPPLDSYAGENPDIVHAATADSSPRPIPEAIPTRKRKPQLSVVGNTVRVQEIDPSADLPPAYSEDALAEAFTLGPGQDWRYTAAWGVWHKWTGQRWEEDVKKQVTWEARNVCREKSNEPGDLTKAGRQKIATLKMVNSVLGLAGADPRHATAPNDWDADPWLLGTPSGVIDLRTGHLTDTDRANLISKSTGVGPQQAETPLWSSILARTSGGDASYAQYLQRWAGYMLTGDTREECFLFVHGPGGSGKSTFVKVLTEIMGDYAVSAPIESFTATDRKEHSTEIARLAGARLVAANETEDGARWNESRIKALTGRDKIAARKMNRDFFEFKPQFKLLFIGNHKPALRSVGEEMKRRIHMVEFPQSIPAEERDLTLKDKLVAEYPAILQWMIEGCLAWQDYRLGEPEQVTKAVSEYLEGEDTLGAWAEECIDLAAISRTAAGDAYRSFVRWAEAAGEYVPSQKRFSQRLEDRGFTRVRSGGTRYFQGFSLRLRPSDSHTSSYSNRDC